MSDNIKVVVKVRPLISREIEEKLFHQWRVKSSTIYQVDQNGKDCGNSFTFDKVYDENTKTTDVYNDIAKPIVEAATTGFNGTIFAYGQTSSGKTYTMTGTKESPGIIPLAVINLFDIIKNIPGRDFLVRVSYVEIYNETLIDLLNIEKKNIKIHDTLQGVKVDATVKVTTSPEEVLQFMREGQANRQTGSTNMNEESSRSHSIFQIIIESREHTEGEEVGCLNVSQLNLVDLAGSERSGQTGATGIRFKEGTHINKSLSFLALVIKQLSEGCSKHVNYRDSKLTRILQNSLGGNAKTSIICAITPAALEETISTLQFAYRAKAIKNNPEVNVVATDSKMIDSLTKQLSLLKTQLESKRNVEEDNHKLQKQITVLQRFLSGFGKRSSAEMMTGSRRKNQPLRRATICTPLSQEEPVPNAPRFCTPSLKYNPMSLASSSEFLPIQNESTLASVPEEPARLVTPPPGDHRITVNDEIIELNDSDDDVPSNVLTCSPYHKCFESSKTPPCVLRKTAIEAEKNFKDLVELTEREKMYTPNVVELIEKLEQNTSVIAKLEEEVNNLSRRNKENNSEVETLRNKISKAEEEVRSVTSAKLKLESLCKDYSTKLTDWEVTCDTLKKKAKTREEELLLRLEEFANSKKFFSTGKVPENAQFKDGQKDMSVVSSDSNVSIASTNDSTSQNIQELITDLKEQLSLRDKTILELESDLRVENQKKSVLESKILEIQTLLESCKQQLNNSEEENGLHKSTIKTLNSIIENQKSNLESATNDIQSYNNTIQELQDELGKKQNVLKAQLSDAEIQNLIENEEKIIANNENINNIIQSLKAALGSKIHEINILKSTIQKNESNNDNNVIVAELENKKSLISELQEKVQTLTQQLKDSKSEIENLLLEKNNLLALQSQISNELSDYRKSKTELDNQIKIYESELNILKVRNQELINTLNEKKGIETELITKNLELKTQVENYVKNINNLENDLILKDAQIESITINGKETKYVYKVIEVICKLQDIVSLLTHESNEYPDISNSSLEVFKTLDDKLWELESSVTEIVDQRDTFKVKNVEYRLATISMEKQSMTEITSINTEINTLINAINDMLNTVIPRSTPVHEDEVNKNIPLESVNNKEKIGVIAKGIPGTEMQFSMDEMKELCLNLKQNIQNINSELSSKFVTISQTLQARGSEIAELSLKLSNLKAESEEKSLQIISISEEKEVIVKERNEILDNIAIRIKKLECELSVVNHLSNDVDVGCDNQIYTSNQILSMLDRLASHVLTMQSDHLTECGYKQEMLVEAKNKIRNLSEQNLEYIDNLSEIKMTNSNLSTELHEMREGNKKLAEDLKTSAQLLKDLKEKLKVKADEIECMENKVLKWKTQFTDLKRFMERRQHDIQEENERLKEKCLQFEAIQREHTDKAEANLMNNEQSYVTQKSLPSIKDHEVNSPQSLLTISCNKIIEIIQDNENSSQSVTLSSSKSSVDRDSSECSGSYCDCKKLKDELKFSQLKNSELLNLLEELQYTNVNLMKEIQEATGEIGTLLNFSRELQKRILNHRTNLSTLTATTYAENKSLSSQVKFLQHHHTRFHTVCQRDLPELKSQLHELMKLLKEESLEKKLNASFKRYSLPNPLDSNSIMYSFKNESTLDGDLLMLDTNDTIATSVDNTLTGNDDTCLEVTQTCLLNDAACQTTVCWQINENASNDSCHYHDITDMIKVLKEENQKLIELVNESSQIEQIVVQKVDAGTSPFKYISEKKISEINFCKNCEHAKEQQDQLDQKLENLKQELVNMTSKKIDFEIKYNNLSLETPSTEALLRKLHNFEKELENKSKEIEKLKSAKELLKSVQEENDNLSTQIMEFISEVDDLKKELDTYKTINSENTNKLNIQLNVENSYDGQGKEECPECVQKDEQLKVLENKYSNTHTRLNRSYSDSDSSSRYNKICTLQNELDAGREDCNELKEEVSTIKNHLERSNLSISQAMDLDESIGDSSVVDSQSNKCYMPKISEEQDSDIYTLDKSDCFNYYIEKVGDENTNLSRDVKIIDIMKMLYSNLMTKHENQIENLVNKLRDYEDSKAVLQEKLDIVTKGFEESNSKIQIIENKLSVLRNNFRSLSNDAIVFNKDSTNVIELFKEKVLKVLDNEFSMNSLDTFESIFKIAFSKSLNNLNETMNQYAKLQEHSQKLTDDLEIANNNLLHMKSQLTDKENECNLLVAQKAKIHEISNAVTMDIVRKEQEFCAAITEGYRKLAKENIVESDNVDTTLPPITNLNLLFKLLINRNTAKIMLEKEKEMNILEQEVTNYKTIVEKKDKELHMLREEFENVQKVNKNINKQLQDEEAKLQTQKSLCEDLSAVYNKKIEENNVNYLMIQKLSEEISVLKGCISEKEKIVQNLQDELNVYKLTSTENESKVSKFLQDIKRSEAEIDNLKSINQSLLNLNESMAVDLKKSEAMIKQNKIDHEKMQSDILILRESVKENVFVIDELKLETESLQQQNLQLKEQLDEKCKDKQNKINLEKMESEVFILKESMKENIIEIDKLKLETESLQQQKLHLQEQLDEKCKELSRLEFNIKTHETTAKIQTKMISRLQKQKDEDNNRISEKDKQLQELCLKCDALQNESMGMKDCIATLKHEIDELKNVKQSLEERISQLEIESLEGNRKPRLSIETITDMSRRRRQSIHDSKRIFDEKPQDHNKTELVLDGRSKPDDFFMDVDENGSSRSTPVRHSKGRDSLQSKHGESEEEERPSRPGSVLATRQRRQSSHDLHRTVLPTTPERHVSDLNKSTDETKHEMSNDGTVNSRVRELQERLSSCQHELEDLKDRYRELDDECETCAQYLRERDEQCARLKKEKTALENIITELNEKLQCANTNSSQNTAKVKFSHAAVNTDEDWANLHSVVVDRMSFDAEVEKNKRLTKTIEELRFNKHELKTMVSKMQRALEEKSSKDARELEKTKAELRSCKEELEGLKKRYKELDEECETCAQYLKERDEQCRRLKEAIAALEFKFQDLQENTCNSSHSVRKKRQTLHDLNRRSTTEHVDASTQISEDFLSHQVERDSKPVPDDTLTKQMKRLKMAVEKLSQQKVALEQQLIAASTAPVYVATGSAVVQNQQLTDVMKENRKLKKMNAELITLCKKRGKAVIRSNQENQDPTEEI